MFSKSSGWVGECLPVGFRSCGSLFEGRRGLLQPWHSRQYTPVYFCWPNSLMRWLLPLFYFRFLDIFDVAEENAAHINILGFLVIVLAVCTVALLLPFLVAVVRARSLHILKFTNPQAAQMAWLGSWFKGLPQMHLSPAKESCIR
jgi:hypothetical protein